MDETTDQASVLETIPHSAHLCGPLMVDVVKATKSYPPNITALQDVSLSIHRGEMVFLTGRSGAGKTTLLRLLCCVETPTKGVVEVAGFDLAKLNRQRVQALRQRIGMAYQDFKLLPERTAAQNIAISMEVAYLSAATIQRRTKRLLGQLRLSDKYDIAAGELSRGEQQRVAIARALANKPEFLLADEPTGNLDAETTTVVMDLFQRVNERGVTLLIATHDQTILTAGHRVLTLDHGCLESSTMSLGQVTLGAGEEA